MGSPQNLLDHACATKRKLDRKGALKGYVFHTRRGHIRSLVRSNDRPTTFLGLTTKVLVGGLASSTWRSGFCAEFDFLSILQLRLGMKGHLNKDLKGQASLDWCWVTM